LAAPDPGVERGGVPAPPSSPPAPGERWTILRLILWSAGYLEAKGVEQARLDAEHLLAHSLGIGRLALYLQHERPVAPEELAAFKPLLLRRAAREPLQYILGRAGFREIDLKVDRRGLIPRPETEVLVGIVLEHARGREGLDAVDIGTGSGAIALSLAREGRFRRVVATDAAPEALALARENADRLGLGDAVEFREGSLLRPLAGDVFDVLVSNPPYVAEVERTSLQPEVADWEPDAALFAGEDGLAVLAPLVAGASTHLRAGGLLALEVGAGQTDVVSELVRKTGAFEAPKVHRDLAGRPRIVAARRGA
jgi:release factor glutamine methyltransferase